MADTNATILNRKSAFRELIDSVNNLKDDLRKSNNSVAKELNNTFSKTFKSMDVSKIFDSIQSSFPPIVSSFIDLFDKKDKKTKEQEKQKIKKQEEKEKKVKEERQKQTGIFTQIHQTLEKMDEKLLQIENNQPKKKNRRAERIKRKEDRKQTQEAQTEKFRQNEEKREEGFREKAKEDQEGDKTGEEITKQFGPFFGLIAGFKKLILVPLLAFVASVAPVAGALFAIPKILASYREEIAGFVDALKPAYEFTVNAASKLIEWGAKFVEGLQWGLSNILFPALGDVIGALTTMGGWVADFAIGTKNLAVEGIEFFTGLGASALKAYEDVSGFIDDTVTFIKEIPEKIMTFVGELKDSIYETITGIIDSIKVAVLDTVNSIKGALNFFGGEDEQKAREMKQDLDTRARVDQSTGEIVEEKAKNLEMIKEAAKEKTRREELAATNTIGNEIVQNVIRSSVVNNNNNINMPVNVRDSDNTFRRLQDMQVSGRTG